MKSNLITLGIALFLITAVQARAEESAERKVLRVSDHAVIPFGQMIGEVKNADIVFVGEIHDVMKHHQDQLAVVKALKDAGKRVAVGLEMFRADSQRTLNAWEKDQLDVTQFLPAYFDNWRMPWSLYQDIFWYARERHVPLVGLNISDAIATKVAREGFASLSKEELKLLPPGISCNVDPTYMAFIKKAYASHGLQDKQFVNFCEAQMVWDKSMAWNLMAYLRKHPGRTMVVLAGVGHAWKRGIPEQVGQEAHYSMRVVLPVIPRQLDREEVSIKDADYVLLD